MYTITQKDASTSNTMVTGIIPISSIFAYILFDTSASHSIVSPSSISKLSLIVKPLGVELLIDTLLEVKW